VAGCSPLDGDCGGAISGVAIAVKNGGGSTILSGTTDVNGRVCWPLPADGTYTVTITSTLPAGYVTPGDQSVTVSGCHDRSAAFCAHLDADHICCHCGVGSGCTGTVRPKHLTLTDEHSSCVLTNPGGNNCAWTGCYTYTEPDGADPSTGPYSDACCEKNSITATIHYTLTCNDGYWLLCRYFHICGPSSQNQGWTFVCHDPPPDDYEFRKLYQTSDSAGCAGTKGIALCAHADDGYDCDPISLSFSFPATWPSGPPPATIPGITGGFATVTE
jgi:hypothetical protein